MVVSVGYNGSENAEAAVRYAADIAARRGTSLTVVTAYRTPIPVYANPAALQAWKEDKAHQQVAESLLEDRKSTRLNSSHVAISYAVFCLKKKKNKTTMSRQ